MEDEKNLRVLIVAEHASAKYGGEAVLPLHYYRILRQRGIPTWLVVHERTREELDVIFPHDANIFYVSDSIWHKMLWKLNKFLPSRLAYFTVGFLSRFLTQMVQRRIIHDLIKTENINLVHQPTPVSPREPSMIFGLGVPVVMGPMNGDMNYPPAFQYLQKKSVNISLLLGRKASILINKLVPGKVGAAALLVANERTRKALPITTNKRVIEVVENGVDLSLWTPTKPRASTKTDSNVKFVYVGRLVDWKAVDLLLLAFNDVRVKTPASLTIIGDGIERNNLTEEARKLALLASNEYEQGKVFFMGWLSQEQCSKKLESFDVHVLPSLLECGGAVVLEAMAKGLPVIATNWGGPADYLDSSCGILVDPSSRGGFIESFSNAMLELARSPEKRHQMGKSGQEKVKQHYDWEVKVDRMIDVYKGVIVENPVG